MIRTAVLLDDRHNRLGYTKVAETVFIIKHCDAFYIRTSKGVRLSGGGIGAVFELTEIVVRDRLEK